MKNLLLIQLLLITAALSACGSETTDTPAQAAAAKVEAVQSASPEVVFKVTGADEAEVEGRINIFCNPAFGANGAYLEIGYVTSRTDLELVLLTDASGTIELIGTRDQGAERGKQNLVQYRSENIVKFDRGSGQLTIKSMPAAQGERFIASLNAELSDKDGNVANLTASFDADAGYQSFDEC